ncbi:MAG: hypothetical protein PHY16_11810 [Methylobacter sp.]|nr:hypothetical protein [Methylobacter sp.]
MQSINDYYKPKRVSEFKTAIPKLRAQIGRETWSNEIKQFGIAGNTFRAFRGWTHMPSDLYRTWAEKQCIAIVPASLAVSVSSKEGFEEWHASLCQSLQKHWKKYESSGLPIAHQYKVIDLYIKWLSQFNFDLPTISSGLIDYSHCAIDSQILLTLNDCLSGALPLGKPSMGHVRYEATYLFCQELVSRFSSHCGGTPLLFDYYAWKPGGG